MRYDVVCERCRAEGELEKPMKAALPPCEACGGTLRRRFRRAPSVLYRAAGFSATDDRLKRQVGPERFAKFEQTKADVERRAKAGRLTEYEKAIEG